MVIGCRERTKRCQGARDCKEMWYGRCQAWTNKVRRAEDGSGSNLNSAAGGGQQHQQLQSLVETLSQTLFSGIPRNLFPSSPFRFYRRHLGDGRLSNSAGARPLYLGLHY